jgi:CspA family cold shock protein
LVSPRRAGKNVFVHISAVEGPGISDLREGAKLSYAELPNKGKTSAENLRMVQVADPLALRLPLRR